jgi:hypothetical protein
MSTRTSLIELREAAVTLHAEEAVAIVQQLIHSLPAFDDVPIEPPFGPPSLQNVYLDDEGVVTCQACQTTPAVAEIAIFLQQLLPEGTPRVPGALRYLIARALHDVDAPPFDSLREFSAALERFENGDRTVVVGTLVARATGVCLDRFRGAREDRRRLVPSSSDFRRELRAADARYYELATASGRIVAAEPLVPEPHRAPSVAMGIVAGICLMFVGEVMHTRSTTPPPPPAPAPAIQQVQAIPPPPSEDMVPLAEEILEPVSVRTGRLAPIATASLGGEHSSKSTVKRAMRRPAQPSRVHRTKNGQGVMDKLHLGWLRNAFVGRKDSL